MVVVEEFVSATYSYEDSGSTMGVMGSRISGKDGGIRRDRSARVCLRMSGLLA